MINYTVLLQFSFMEHKAVLVGWHTPARYIFMEQNPVFAFTVLTSSAYIYIVQLSERMKYFMLMCNFFQ